WSPVESSLHVEAVCSFRLAIVEHHADTGGAEETIEIEVECEFSVTYAHRRLVLVARGCNDLAMKWLGTRSPTDKQTIFHQFCVPDTQLSQFQ
ncbi:uncharacterized protein ACA1_010390, partial [Acanthamoeba castellanii str. Neff]